MSSSILLVVAAFSGATPLVMGAFVVCVMLYGIVYAPWDRSQQVFRDKRNRLASVWVVGGAGFFMIFVILYVAMSPDHTWQLSVTGAGMLGLGVWRGSCELIHQATGRARVLNFML